MAGAGRATEGAKFRITLNSPEEAFLGQLAEGRLLIEPLVDEQAGLTDGEVDKLADELDLCSASQGARRLGQVQAYIYTPLGPATVASRPFRSKVDEAGKLTSREVKVRYRVAGGGLV